MRRLDRRTREGKGGVERCGKEHTECDGLEERVCREVCEGRLHIQYCAEPVQLN